MLLIWLIFMVWKYIPLTLFIFSVIHILKYFFLSDHSFVSVRISLSLSACFFSLMIDFAISLCKYCYFLILLCIILFSIYYLERYCYRINFGQCCHQNTHFKLKAINKIFIYYYFPSFGLEIVYKYCSCFHYFYKLTSNSNLYF